MHNSRRPFASVLGIPVLVILAGLAAPTFTAAQVVKSTGFEASDGWNLGFICDPTVFTNCQGPPLPLNGECDGDPLVDGNCCAYDPNPYTGWYLSISSEHCREPHIDTANPATGDQHIRFDRDPEGGDPAGCVGTDTNCRITAFTPTVPNPGAVPTTISYNIAMGGVAQQTPYGSSFTMWFLAPAGIGDSHYFDYYGTAYFYDYGLSSYYPMGYMTGDGVYDSVVESRDPCNDTACYTFNGETTCQSAGMAGMAGSIVRLIMVHDNDIYPWDIDDYSIVRGDPCPTTCGNGILEPGEHCDGPGLDDVCPGMCVAPGCQDLSCTCNMGDPFTRYQLVVNGRNGPFPGGYQCPSDSNNGLFKYPADAPYTSINTCGSDYDTEIWWDFNEAGDRFEYTNNDCTSTGETGDPTAPCAGGGTGSCLCVPTVPGQEYTFAVGGYDDIFPPPPGTETYIAISKKLRCGELIPNGACCDGDAGICTDNVTIEQCSCDQCAWSENKLCSMVTCEHDTGACCDHSPGLGGLCVDDLYHQQCSGNQQAYHKGELCDAVVCEEAGGACCDGLLGDCVNGMLESECNCQQCAWSKGLECVDVDCLPAYGACCNRDDGSCQSTPAMECTCEKCVWAKGRACAVLWCKANFDPIPTTSTWGLAILALLLLAAGKIYFRGRIVNPKDGN